MEIDVKCSYCNKSFKLTKTIYNKRKKRNKFLYCSPKCSSNARIKLSSFICTNCGKSFYRNPHRNKSKNIFCSQSCSNSYNNRFKQRMSINTYRRIAFENFEHKCAICGWNEDERVLEVHHKDEDRKNNHISNLIILCPICHKYLTLHIKTLNDR